MALLAKHREFTGQLSLPWPDAVVIPCQRGLKLLQQRRETLSQLGQPLPSDVVEELEKGLRLLEEVCQLTEQLSVQYSAQVEQLNVIQLQREWAKAEKAMWPISWLGKRKIRSALDAAVAGEGEPDVGKDLRSLVKIRALRSEVSALEMDPATDGIWAGLKTRPEVAQCALKFQHALGAARSEQPWQDDGFEPIAKGRCGELLAKELTRLRALMALDAELKALENLSSATSGLWAGIATQTEILEAALRFQAELRDVQASGALSRDHEAVARGECGEKQLADFQRVCQRAVVEQKLAACGDLRDPTAGLWRGLETQVDNVEKALRFHSSVSTAIANLAARPEEIGALKESLDRLIGEGNALLEPSGPITGAGEAYLSVLGVLQPTIDTLTVAGRFSDPGKADFEQVPLNELIERCAALIRSESRLHAWCAWRKVRDHAVTFGLAPLVAGIENGAVAQGTMRGAFETNYSRWWLNSVVEQEPVIRTFVSAEHEKRIGDFRVLDERFTKVTREWVRAGLCAEMPQQDSVTREFGVGSSAA